MVQVHACLGAPVEDIGCQGALDQRQEPGRGVEPIQVGEQVLQGFESGSVLALLIQAVHVLKSCLAQELLADLEQVGQLDPVDSTRLVAAVPRQARVQGLAEHARTLHGLFGISLG